jgi:polygalacturonase
LQFKRKVFGNYYAHSNMACLHAFSLLALFHLFNNAEAATSSTTIAAAVPTTTVTVDYTKIINERGDQLPDFSYCGYHASEKTLPLDNTTASLTLSPGEGDQAPQIQAALDKVAAGGGGVVALDAGTFEIGEGLTIQSNTTLRGAGVGVSILALSNVSSDFISIGAANVGNVTEGATTNITDSYVPVGTSKVTVASTDGFTIGQTIFIQSTASAAWIEANGMNNLVRRGRHQTWIKVCSFDLTAYALVLLIDLACKGRKNYEAATGNQEHLRQCHHGRYTLN